MRNRLLSIMILMMAVPALADDPPSAPLPSIQLPPELARVLRDYEAGWRAGDGAALARLFVEDGFVLSNGTPPVRGSEAIRRHYRGPGGPLVLRAFACATDGTLGYILGGFSRKDADPDIGKFTLTLRKSPDGKWLIVSDMDNGNRPPPRPATPTAVP
jgi:ketosteroid isomerase-like protein